MSNTKGMSTKDAVSFLRKKAAEIRSQAKKIADDGEQLLLLIQAKKYERRADMIQAVGKRREVGAVEIWHREEV